MFQRDRSILYHRSWRLDGFGLATRPRLAAYFLPACCVLEAGLRAKHTARLEHCNVIISHHFHVRTAGSMHCLCFFMCLIQG